MRVVILTSFTPSSVYQVNEIIRAKNVVGVIVESKRGKRSGIFFKRIRKEIQKNGIFRVLAKLIEGFYFALQVWKMERTQRRFFPLPKEKMQYDQSVPVFCTKNVNDVETLQKIREWNPDLLVVSGTGILKEKLIELPPKGVINLHGGLVPEYRGLKPEFWVLYNNEPQKMGVTVHYLVEKIDAGDIILQKKVEVKPGDDENILRCRAVVVGTRLLIEAIAQIENGTLKPIKQNLEKGHYYSMPSMTQYHALHKRLRAQKRNAR